MRKEQIKKKKMRHLFRASLLVLLAAFSLAACGTKPHEYTPTQITTIYMQAMTDQVYTDWNLYSEEELSRDTFLEEIIRGLTGDTSLPLTEQQKEEFAASLLVGLSKTTYQILSEKITEDTAEVIIAVNGINVDALIQQLRIDVDEQIAQELLANETDVYTFIIADITEKLRDPQLMETPINITVPFTYVNKKWVLTSEDALSQIVFKGLFYSDYF